MSPINLLTICLAAVILVVTAEPESDIFGKIETPDGVDFAAELENVLRNQTDNILDSRVANGKLAGRNQFPWQATVFVRRGQNSWIFCSGALLSRNTVLTHADCIGQNQPVTVQLGSNQFQSGLRIPVDRVAYHPRYNTNANRFKFYNIAILRLSRSVAPSVNIQIIPLPPQKFVAFAFQNHFTRFAGFGTNCKYFHIFKMYFSMNFSFYFLSSSHCLTASTNPSRSLRWATFRVTPIPICARHFPLPNNVNHMIICIRNENPRIHPGFGDIGAPVIWRYRNRNFIIGIFARVKTPGNISRGPHGVINIAAHSRWIASVIHQPPQPPNVPPTPPSPPRP